MRPLYAAPLAIALTLLSAGCQPSECAQMMSCCEAVKDLEGLGSACGPLAAQTRDLNTCRDIKLTVRYMLEDRKKTIPEICQ